jgi:hypothetical protein
MKLFIKWKKKIEKFKRIIKKIYYFLIKKKEINFSL